MLSKLSRLLHEVDAAAAVHEARNLAMMIDRLQSGRALDLIVIDVGGVGVSWPDRVVWMARRYPSTLLVTYGAAPLGDSVAPAVRAGIAASLLKGAERRPLRLLMTDYLRRRNAVAAQPFDPAPVCTTRRYGVSAVRR